MELEQENQRGNCLERWRRRARLKPYRVDRALGFTIGQTLRYEKLGLARVRLCDLIRPLIAHFQKAFEAENKTILMKTVRYMERYPWKGNIRELENEMERLMTIVPASRIEPDHLSSKFFLDHERESHNRFDCTYPEFITWLEQREREYIITNLSKSSSLREFKSDTVAGPTRRPRLISRNFDSMCISEHIRASSH